MLEMSKEASRWFQLLAILVFPAEASNIKGQRQAMPVVPHPIDGGCVMRQVLGWFITSSGYLEQLWSRHQRCLVVEHLEEEKDETENCLVSIKQQSNVSSQQGNSCKNADSFRLQSPFLHQVGWMHWPLPPGHSPLRGAAVRTVRTGPLMSQYYGWPHPSLALRLPGCRRQSL